MDISRFLKKKRKSRLLKRTKEDLRVIANLSNKKATGRLSDAEKIKLHELCYNRDPIFPKKNIEKIKTRFGEASRDLKNK
ncbi:hypothetical protein KAS31_04810 [Candidatus Parcubacteria bacterium]|nr:hypothetical protein [Candidatus Parcubacteria bacterium]MCK5085440.1 hypothetical protein [Candidatus Parcubacteria bacterium]